MNPEEILIRKRAELAQAIMVAIAPRGLFTDPDHVAATAVRFADALLCRLVDTADDAKPITDGTL